MANGDTTLDTEDMLRRKQILQEMNAITGNPSGTAMLGGGANLQAFNTPGAAQQQQTAKKGGGFLGTLLGAAAIPAMTAGGQLASASVSPMLQPKEFLANKLAGVINPNAQRQQQNNQALLNQAADKQQGWNQINQQQFNNSALPIDPNAPVFRRQYDPSLLQ